MKMSEAMFIMHREHEGYMVSFEHAGDGFLRSDHFPDKHAGEDLIDTKEEAWQLAHKFAARTVGKCVNIRLIDANFKPIDSRVIINRSNK